MRYTRKFARKHQLEWSKRCLSASALDMAAGPAKTVAAGAMVALGEASGCTN
jgi:hypothetical protein